MTKKAKTGFWRKAGRLIMILFLSSLVYTLVCKWLFPPVTITQLSALVSGYGLKRDYVGWDDISDNVKLAAMASEDQLFPDHGGFDWNAIEKSLDGTTTTRKKKKKSRGAAASTITQQTAKNVFLWQGGRYDRYIRKVPEAWFTKLIEWTWGKKRILEVYLNVAEMGPGIFGIEAASREYFHKSAKNLTRAEAAQIVAALPNPKRFTVRPVSRRVKWRYPQIVRQMSNLDGDPDIQHLLRQ